MQRVSKKFISEQVDKAEIAFSTCWQILESIKAGVFNPEEFFKFQPILAENIYELAKVFHEISIKKKELIKQKKTYNPIWFRKRLKTLSDYQIVVATAISIGKRLGDYFAWFFYSKEHVMLGQHSKHRPILIPPTGIGGLGEKNIAMRFQRHRKLFVLHHGVTSILRIGDVSLISLKGLRLAAIGEVKTKKSSPKELLVQMRFASKNREFLQEHLEEPSSFILQKDQNELDHTIAEKLKRQMRGIAASFSGETIAGATTVGKHTIEDFISLFSDTTKPQVGLMGKSQVILTLPNNKPTLSKRLFTSSFLFDKQNSGAHSEVSNQLLKKIQSLFTSTLIPDVENRIFMGNRYNPGQSNPLLHSVIPMFWLPIPSTIVRRLTFYETEILSILNAGHLFAELKPLGLEVTLTNKKFTARNHVKGYDIENFEFFVRLVAEAFLSETSVQHILSKCIADIENANLPKGSKVTLDIHQVYEGKI